MTKIKSLTELKQLREQLQSKLNLREKSNHPEEMVQIKVSMATCGIASGAKETMDYIVNQLDNLSIDAVVTQTGCMGYCYAEPTIEVKRPNEAPIVFGYVDEKKAQEIIDKYVVAGELVNEIIPVNYQTINDKV